MAVLLFSRSNCDCVADTIIQMGVHDTIDIDPLHEDVAVEHHPDEGVTRLAEKSAINERLRAFDYSHTLINRAYISNQIGFPEGQNPRECRLLLTETLSRFIEQFPHRSARVGLHSLVGDAMPLYLQWKTLRDDKLPVATPSYHYAFSSQPPLADAFTAPIYKNPFDLDCWRSNSPPDSHWHTFVVDRPAGRPICTFIFDEICRTFCPTGQQLDLSRSSQKSLQDITRRAAQLFGSAIAEILFFVDDEAITFAAFSSVPKTASQQLEFPNWVEDGLQKFLQRRPLSENLLQSA